MSSPVWPASIAPATDHRVGVSHRVRGLSAQQLFFTVPLDHFGAPGGPTITVHARLIVAADKTEKAAAELPYLVFLQGGPGFPSPRPTELGGWLGEAVKQFRVLLLDQRGTGLSSRISVAALQALGSAEAQAEYVSHFRADSIVADCEAIRKALGVEKWSLLGQSFGGFCSTTYLSFAPAGLREVCMTGGLPPRPGSACPDSADETYRRTFVRAVEATGRYYKRFPGDVDIIRRIVLHLAGSPGGGVDLPSGGRLTPRGLQIVGWGLGGVGGFEALHHLLEAAFECPCAGVEAKEALSLAFLTGFEQLFSWDTNPLYLLVHEACYANGGATGWAAQRVRDSPQFSAAFDAVACARAGKPVMLTGEMCFPWLTEEVASLRPVAAAAQLLAERNWRRSLYDLDALAKNTVPVACSVYHDDLYVDRALSLETLDGINGARIWMTSEFLHSGVREDGPRVLKTLLAMARDEEPVR